MYIQYQIFTEANSRHTKLDIGESDLFPGQRCRAPGLTGHSPAPMTTLAH